MKPETGRKVWPVRQEVYAAFGNGRKLQRIGFGIACRRSKFIRKKHIISNLYFGDGNTAVFSVNQ